MPKSGQARRAGAVRTARLSHVNTQGAARMVEVGPKPETMRRATATGRVAMAPATAAAVAAGSIRKGEVLGVARIAGIEAAKRTADLIPLCHPLRITGVDVGFVIGERAVEITAVVSAFDRTGVEMEALAAVCAAALTIYDMCKAIDREMVIADVCLQEKRGGRSGIWLRPSPRASKR